MIVGIITVSVGSGAGVKKVSISKTALSKSAAKACRAASGSDFKEGFNPWVVALSLTTY